MSQSNPVSKFWSGLFGQNKKGSQPDGAAEVEPDVAQAAPPAENSELTPAEQASAADAHVVSHGEVASPAGGEPPEEVPMGPDSEAAAPPAVEPVADGAETQPAVIEEPSIVPEAAAEEAAAPADHLAPTEESAPAVPAAVPDVPTVNAAAVEAIEEVVEPAISTESGNAPAVENVESSLAPLGEAPPVADTPAAGAPEAQPEEPKPVEPQPVKPKTLEEIVSEAVDNDAEQYADDCRRADGHYTELVKWTELSNTLKIGIAAASDESLRLIAGAKETFESIPNADAKTDLEPRQQSLDLIGRMITRMQERFAAASSAPDVKREQPEVSADSLAAVVAKLRENPADDCAQIISSEAKRISNIRWSNLSELRTAADSRRSDFQKSLERVLPVLDGLEEGERISTDLVSGLVSKESSCRALLDRWLGTYGLCRKKLIAALGAVGVAVMETGQAGDDLDLDREEPFDVVYFEGDAHKDETIKERVRSGYELRVSDQQPAVVLRPAQVVVYKRKGDGADA